MKKATSEGTIYSPLKEFAEHQGKISLSPTHLDREIQTDIQMEFFNTLLNDLQKQAQALFGHKNALLANSDSADGMKPELKVVNGAQKTWCIKCSKETLGRCSHAEKTDTDSKNFQNNFELYSQIESENDKTVNSIDDGQSWSADKNDEFQIKLKSHNFVEVVAYWYHVECEINDLPVKKRKKLDEHFTRLFGKDHNIDYYFLTDEQKSLTCRKRIAKYVVGELTNYYNKKKIASKDVFKTLAKHITSLLLGRSLYPGEMNNFDMYEYLFLFVNKFCTVFFALTAPDDIKKSVEEFFHSGRVIRNEDDFYI